MRHRFARLTVYMTVVALVLGNLVVATKAGDACGTDWPKCNGKLIPDFTDYKVLIEYSHRMFTGSLGFVMLINFILSWKMKYITESAVKVLSILSIFLLLLQSLVGGLNVLLGTPPGFTTFDVTISLLLLTSLVLLLAGLERIGVQPIKEKMQINCHYRQLFKPAFAAFSLFFLEIVIGAFFKHSGASKIVNNLITDETLIKSFVLSDIIYSTHGIINTIILVYAGYVVFLSIRKKVLVKNSMIFFILIIMNGVTGYITQLSKVNEVYSSLHMIIVILTVFQGSYLMSKSYFGPYFLKK